MPTSPPAHLDLICYIGEDFQRTFTVSGNVATGATATMQVRSSRATDPVLATIGVQLSYLTQTNLTTIACTLTRSVTGALAAQTARYDLRIGGGSVPHEYYLEGAFIIREAMSA